MPGQPARHVRISEGHRGSSQPVGRVVEGQDEPIEQTREVGALLEGELTEDLGHRVGASSVDGGVTVAPVVGDAHHHDPPVVVGRVPFGEPLGDEPLHSTGRAGRIDPEPLGELLHRPVPPCQQVECVHLPRFERVVVTEQVVAEVVGPCAATEFDPRPSDPDRVLDVDRIREVDGIGRTDHGGADATAVTRARPDRTFDANERQCRRSCLTGLPMNRSESDQRAIDRLHGLLGIPPTFGNEVRVLRNGDEIFAAMLAAIRNATRTVDFVTFVYWSGDIAVTFAEELRDAARRGCRVRVLLDAVGARKIDESLIDQMSKSGCDVRWFRPFFDKKVPKIAEANRRTHRKILVCDNTIGFCGGVGIAEEWTGNARDESEWRDTHLAVRGPAVAGLLSAFLDNWADQHEDGYDARGEHDVDFTEYGSTAMFVVRGSSETGASDVWRMIMTLVSMAERRLRIATAYFNPDRFVIDALVAAVERGVHVTLLVPGEHHDKRFIQIAGEEAYQELLDAGVDIRTYEVSMMHAKVMTVDGRIATVGSTNFNRRSMQHDEEANVVLVDEDVVSVLDLHLDDDLTKSIELDPSRWADRGLSQRMAEKVSTVVEKWL